MCKAIWRACQTPDDVKLIEFQTTLRKRELIWFIKWPEIHQNPIVDDVKREFVQEFKLPQTNQ